RPGFEAAVDGELRGGRGGSGDESTGRDERQHQEDSFHVQTPDYSPLWRVVMRRPEDVSPDISQTIAPKRPLLLSHAVFCPIDQVSSNVHHCPPFPVKQ